MTQFDIGQEIVFRHRGNVHRGIVMGREDAGQRHGMPRGVLLYVQVDGEQGQGWREVHQNQVTEQRA